MKQNANPRLDAVLGMLRKQREAALDAIVQLSGELAEAKAKISEQEEMIASVMKAQAEQHSATITPITGTNDAA